MSLNLECKKTPLASPSLSKSFPLLKERLLEDDLWFLIGGEVEFILK